MRSSRSGAGNPLGLDEWSRYFRRPDMHGIEALHARFVFIPSRSQLSHCIYQRPHATDRDLAPPDPAFLYTRPDNCSVGFAQQFIRVFHGKSTSDDHRQKGAAPDVLYLLNRRWIAGMITGRYRDVGIEKLCVSRLLYDGSVGNYGVRTMLDVNVSKHCDFLSVQSGSVTKNPSTVSLYKTFVGNVSVYKLVNSNKRTTSRFGHGDRRFAGIR
jgi:hypothetical protein